MKIHPLGWLLYYMCITAMPVGAALWRVKVHHGIVQMGYVMSQEEQKRSELRQRLKALEVELATVKSPAHLSKWAQKLKLSPPQPTQFLGYVEPVSTKPRSASHLPESDKGSSNNGYPE
jgi:hypothetical protein